MAATTARPQVPTGWSTWQGWQFSAGYNGRGRVYGFQSSDLDLNIIRDDVWERWLGIQPAPDPHPAPAPKADSLEEDMPPFIVCNAEQFGDQPPTKVKFRVVPVLIDGEPKFKLQHLNLGQWKALGADEGTPLTNAELNAIGA